MLIESLSLSLPFSLSLFLSLFLKITVEITCCFYFPIIFKVILIHWIKLFTCVVHLNKYYKKLKKSAFHATLTYIYMYINKTFYNARQILSTRRAILNGTYDMKYLEKYVTKIMLFNPGRLVSAVYYIYVIEIYKIEKSMLQMFAEKRWYPNIYGFS